MIDALEVLMEVYEEEEVEMTLDTVVEGSGGTTDYRALSHKPTINEHELNGDSNFEDIGLHFMTNTEIRDLLRRGN